MNVVDILRELGKGGKETSIAGAKSDPGQCTSVTQTTRRGGDGHFREKNASNNADVMIQLFSEKKILISISNDFSE